MFTKNNHLYLMLNLLYCIIQREECYFKLCTLSLTYWECVFVFWVLLISEIFIVITEAFASSLFIWQMQVWKNKTKPCFVLLEYITNRQTLNVLILWILTISLKTWYTVRYHYHLSFILCINWVRFRFQVLCLILDIYWWIEQKWLLLFEELTVYG